MLSASSAKELALSIWNEGRRVEMPRLDAIDMAMKVVPSLPAGGTVRGAYRAGVYAPSVIIPPDAPNTMWELAAKAPTNYLPLLVEIYQQALRVEGYLPTEDRGENPWEWWQANRMDARQVGVHQSALKYGAAYVLAMPGMTAAGEPGPTARAFTPRRMTAIYQDPEQDEWPIAAVYVDGPNGEHMVLVDEDGEYRFALGAMAAAPGAGFTDQAMTTVGGRQVDYVGPRPHNAGMGETPIIRYRDSFLLEGEEQFGIVEPVMVIQRRIDETNFEQLVAQFFTAFKQRIVLGWVPESESEEMKANAASAWYLDVNPEDVRIQELGGADPGVYTEAGQNARRDLAAITQLPVDAFGVTSISNISDATLAGLNESKNRRAGSIALALGESHEQLMRTFAFMSGNFDASRDYKGEVRWSEREQRTWGSLVDGLVKLVQAQVIPRATALEMVPGLTDHQIELATQQLRRERSAEALATLREASARMPDRAGPVVDVGNLPDARE